MRKDKEEAIALRKNGKSYREIKERLSVPKSTLSGWLSGFDWSVEVGKTNLAGVQAQNAIRLKDLNNVRGANLERLYGEARIEAVQEFTELKNNLIFLAGILIYWGEGDKVSRNHVRISNTDPLMIKIFTLFLERIINIPQDRIKISLLIYPDLDDNICRKYWSEKIGLSDSNFYKTSTIVGRHTTKRVQYGVCSIGISSRYLKEKMKVWMSELPNYIVGQVKN